MGNEVHGILCLLSPSQRTANKLTLVSEPYGSSSGFVLLPLKAKHNKGIITDTESIKTLRTLTMPNGDQDTDRRGHRRDRSPTRSATTQNSHRSSKPAAAQMTRPVETQVDLRTRTPYQKPLSQEEESEIYKAMRNLNLHVDAKGKEYVRGDLDEQNLTQEGGAPVTKPELGPKRNVVKGYDVMKHTPEVKAARFRTKARALEEKDAQASLEPSFANKSAASSRRRQSSMEEPYPPKTAERRYSNTSSRLSPESQRPSRPGPSQTLEHARSFSRSPPRDHAPSRSSYKSTATLEPDTPRDYSPPREENSKARRSLRPRHQQSDDRAYSRTRSPERMSRQPRSEKSRKKSTRRYSKSRSPIRKKGALRPSDPRTTKANDGSLGPGENFRDSVESYPPPPINPFIDGLMPSCESTSCLPNRVSPA